MPRSVIRSDRLILSRTKRRGKCISRKLIFSMRYLILLTIVLIFVCSRFTGHISSSRVTDSTTASSSSEKTHVRPTDVLLTTLRNTALLSKKPERSSYTPLPLKNISENTSFLHGGKNSWNFPTSSSTSSVFMLTNATIIIVITYFPSGSALLEDILQVNAGIYRHVDPLAMITSRERVSNDNLAFNLLQKLFACDFQHMANYTKWLSKSRSDWNKRNLVLSSSCKNKSKIECSDGSVMSSVCKRCPWQVLATDRIGVPNIKLFMDENPYLKIKLVHLLRDPRNILMHRQHLNMCAGVECFDQISLTCMVTDVDSISDIQLSFTDNRASVITLESLVEDPLRISSILFPLLGLPFNSATKEAVLKVLDKFDSITANNSIRYRYNAWAKLLTFPEAKLLQKKLYVLLMKLGHFQLIDNELDFIRLKAI